MAGTRTRPGTGSGRLDLAHQIDVLELVARLPKEAGRTVVMVLHDLNLVARYADRLVAMEGGRIVTHGEPAGVLTEELLADVFGLTARVIPDPMAGTPLVVPHRVTAPLGFAQPADPRTTDAWAKDAV